jgi:hypothetical protein
MDAENTFGRVEKDAVILERCKEGTEVLLVFLGRSAEDEDVVEIGETEIQVFPDVGHETLESLSGVSQPKGHEGKFE